VRLRPAAAGPVNLLDNARRHTPDGGAITVCVEAGDPCAVVVADTGPGVPDDERDRVFGRLVRLQQARDRDSGGAGLGLPFARALARAHGGELVAEPSTAGARFRLTLPVAETEA
jgi:two-component system, OmpR family, sensor kinase